jgi:two-component system cell cycle sensor histidine kinase/response regulator CckA
MGLSTVMGIAKGHAGFLLVHSTVGVGTEFTIYLPAVEVEQNKLREGASCPPPGGHGETVLVVDDEAAICMMTQKNLEFHGYKVLTAQNGMEAVSVFTSNPGTIKVVLTDMMMPGMDGTATVKAIRKLNPSVCVVGASGMEGIRDSAEGAGASFDAFLSKPFKVDDLLRTLNQVLRN